MNTVTAAPLGFVMAGALMVLLSSLPVSRAQAKQTIALNTDCTSSLSVDSGTIASITDGDTVVLSDNRRVRLIGINTLEMNEPKAEHKKAAARAKEALSELLPANEPVLLFVGVESHDRHNRLLAHVVRQSDKLAVAKVLLEKGHAMQSAVAPNTRCADYFAALEKQARARRLGLWQNAASLNTSATSISNKSRGFKLITGTVTSVRNDTNTMAFTLDDRLTVLARSELIRHGSTNQPLSILLGKKVEVRGWLSRKKNRTQLWLQHLSNFRLVSE